MADWFTLYLTSEQDAYQQNYITGNTFTFTGIPASSRYEFTMQAVFDDRFSLFSDILIIEVDSK